MSFFSFISFFVSFFGSSFPFFLPLLPVPRLSGGGAARLRSVASIFQGEEEAGASWPRRTEERCLRRFFFFSFSFLVSLVSLLFCCFGAAWARMSLARASSHLPLFFLSSFVPSLLCFVGCLFTCFLSSSIFPSCSLSFSFCCFVVCCCLIGAAWSRLPFARSSSHLG